MECERPGVSPPGRIEPADVRPLIFKLASSKGARMKATALAPAARCTITAAHLLDAPLDDLLLELDVELHLSQITDPGFIGALVQLPDGTLILSMPPGRPRLERDTVARAMLGQVIGVPLGPLPELYQLTEI